MAICYVLLSILDVKAITMNNHCSHAVYILRGGDM